MWPFYITVYVGDFQLKTVMSVINCPRGIEAETVKISKQVLFFWKA